MEYQSLLSSVWNMRELGGLRAGNGKTIRKGYFYRSGHLASMTDEDKKKLDEMGIGTVLDLRTPSEAERIPDYHGNFLYVNAPAYVDQPPKAGTRGIPSDLLYKTMGEEEYYFKKYEFTYGYRFFPFVPSYVKPLLEALDRHEPILFHCAGGKDRTGVMAMILEMLFGVSRNDALRDYLLTNDYGRERFDAIYRDFDAKYHNLWALKVQKFYCEAVPEFFHIAWNAVRSQYETADDYLMNEFGATKEQIADWRDFYLE